MIDSHAFQICQQYTMTQTAPIAFSKFYSLHMHERLYNRQVVLKFKWYLMSINSFLADPSRFTIFKCF